jgi:hypothetical protein
MRCGGSVRMKKKRRERWSSNAKKKNCRRGREKEREGEF